MLNTVALAVMGAHWARRSDPPLPVAMLSSVTLAHIPEAAPIKCVVRVSDVGAIFSLTV